jgi:transposase-like protein
MCRIKLSELFQAVLESEVDAALERLRYERQSSDTKVGYRDGHDRPRSIASNRGPIEIRRPRVRGAAFRYRSATEASAPPSKRRQEHH